MSTATLQRRRSRRGFSSANTVVWLPVIIMMSWWALENALLYRWAYRAQAAADAAALAAAARYRDGRETASNDAVSAAGATDGPAGAITIDVGDGTSGGQDLEFGLWDDQARTFTPDDVDGGEAVRVTVRFAPGHPNGAPAMLLGGLFNPGGISITRRSTAVYVPPRHETSMLVTAKSGTGLSMRGSAVVSSRGGVSLATSSSEAAALTSGTRASVAVLRTAGALDKMSRARVDGAIEEGADIPEDPFDPVPLPALDEASARDIVVDGSGETLVAPGVHSGLSAGSGVIVLKPGLHQFTGPIVLDGSAALLLSAATVQLGAGAGISMAGSAAITGTPALSIPGWEGVAVISGGGATWTIEAAAALEVDAMLYAPSVEATVAGSATVRAGSAILGSLTVIESAMTELAGEIEALETDPVPGRARLVR